MQLHNSSNGKIMVSICCLAYNHEPYIRQCLDGFMIQKTDFPVEVLIHDDASTDGTADIIREYEAKYPDIIKPIYQTENQYSKGISVSCVYQFPRAKGKYIALCEGDDYWTDPNKLQKQVDFLEANEDFSICFHNVKIKREKENDIITDYITRKVPDITDIHELAKGNYMHTPSVVFRRNDEVFKIISSPDIFVIDYVLHMFNAKFGKIKKIPDIMAVYRIHFSNAWVNNDSISQSKNIQRYLKGLMDRFSPEINQVLKKRFINTSLYLAKYYHNIGNSELSLFYFLEALNVQPNNIISNYFKKTMRNTLLLLAKRVFYQKIYYKIKRMLFNYI